MVARSPAFRSCAASTARRPRRRRRRRPRRRRPAPAPPPDNCGRIVLRGVNFAFDSAEIDGSSSVVLDAAADQLNECRNVAVRVEGHTDSDRHGRLQPGSVGAARGERAEPPDRPGRVGVAADRRGLRRVAADREQRHGRGSSAQPPGRAEDPVAALCGARDPGVPTPGSRAAHPDRAARASRARRARGPCRTPADRETEPAASARGCRPPACLHARAKSHAERSSPAML